MGPLKLSAKMDAERMREVTPESGVARWAVRKTGAEMVGQSQDVGTSRESHRIHRS